MNSGPILRSGSSGEDVKRLQRILIFALPCQLEIDGFFGPKTEEAVKLFQEGVGLMGDGIVGPETWKQLPSDPNTPILQPGDSGPVVEALQKALKKMSSSPGDAFDLGPVDGIFGPRTETAVRAYQTERGVAVDGIVGDQTWWTPAGAMSATLASLAGLIGK